MRYAIQNAAGLLYTDNKVPETVYVPRKDNPTVADPRSFLVPLFGTTSGALCLKYDTAADAQNMISHPDLQDPAAFDGCTVVEVEFDPLDLGAVRAVPVQ